MLCRWEVDGFILLQSKSGNFTGIISSEMFQVEHNKLSTCFACGRLSVGSLLPPVSLTIALEAFLSPAGHALKYFPRALHTQYNVCYIAHAHCDQEIFSHSFQCGQHWHLSMLWGQILRHSTATPLPVCTFPHWEILLVPN